jgi:selenocysteine-specific elongation factor
LSLLPSAKPLKNRASVHLHAYTSETVAEVGFGGEKDVKPGEKTYARLRLADPLLIHPEDRFIIRQFSPVVTIGGGEVVDATPVTRRLHRDAAFEALANGDPKAILQARVWRAFDDAIWLETLVAETGWTKSRIESLLTEPIKAGDIVRIGDLFLVKTAWQVLYEQVLSSTAEFQKENPLARGIGKKELQVQTDASSDDVFEAILQRLLADRRVEVDGDLVRLPGRGVVMKDEEAESKKIIEQAFASAGLQVPALYTVLAGLKVDKARAQKIVTLLLRDKTLVKISEELVFHHSALAKLREQLATYKAKSAVAGVAKIDVGKFKEMTGVSRKYAIPLLEYLDRERVTRRVGDERIIL